MNDNFLEIISATSGERRDLFLTAAARLGTTEQNIEKDFWVCWVLDALFHGLPPGGPRHLFKGGTSLSKAWGLISRFSEDIDITVFREDLGQAATVAQLEALSRKKRNARLDEIKLACQHYISAQLREILAGLIDETAERSGLAAGQFRITLDEDDPDGQSLLCGIQPRRQSKAMFTKPSRSNRERNRRSIPTMRPRFGHTSPTMLHL